MKLIYVMISLSLFFSSFAHSAGWEAVDKNISEQKFQAALDGTLEILAKANKEKKSIVQREALIRATQLEVGLHGYETAVKFLQSSPWPKDDESSVLLPLYLAQSLVRYQQIYSYEIMGREEVKGKTDLASLTTLEIGREISKLFDQALGKSSSLNKPIPSDFLPYLSLSTFPKGVRPTLRDAITYLAVDHLANQQFWEPREISEVYRLKISELLTQNKRIPAADQSKHPLVKASSWLGELAKLNKEGRASDAWLEANYVRFNLLHASVSEEADRAAIRIALKKFQTENNRTNWWARGQARLAEFILQEEADDRNVRARAEAEVGNKNFPDSVAAKFCSALLFEIEKKDYRLSTMKADAAEKRSIYLEYKNISKIYFRLYRRDFEDLLKQKNGAELLQFDNQKSLLAITGEKPVATWSQTLAPTTDFQHHRAFVVTPKLGNGAYVLLSSLEENFSRENNLIQGSNIQITNLTLATTNEGRGSLEAQVFLSDSGEPAAGAEVSLYRYQWNLAPERQKTLTTDASGMVRFEKPLKLPFTNSYWNYFLVARHRGSLALETQGIWFGEEQAEKSVKSGFYYTDRSIYRPEQKILFKLVAYSGKAGAYETAKAGETVKVSLFDPNGQRAAEISVKLSTFGTGSGEFVIPKGKPLGSWSLRSDQFVGRGSVRVEEYKRPTFEANFQDAESLRLGKPATFKGEAKYYFGQTLSSGEVSWRITRTEMSPWWWSWWRPSHNLPEIVASGKSSVGSRGEFSVTFTPTADERKAADKSFSYNFRLEAEVTDEGGETRTASRSFRLGFVAVEAKFESALGFFEATKPEKLTALLTNLDGKGISGTGSFTLSRLNAPATSLPSDLPLIQASKSRFNLPDDLRRARWDTAYNWEEITKTWPKGEILSKGVVAHDAQGNGSIPFLAKESGVYRLEYQTKDAFGGVFHAEKDFVVAAPKGKVNLPLLAVVEKKSYVAGEKARVFLHSGFEKQKLYIETYRAGKRINSKVITSGQNNSVVEIPLTSEDRGGISLSVKGLRDHQVFSAQVNVPVTWKEKELNLEFSSFRDTLKPGQKETFRVKVKDSNNKPLGASAAEVLAYMYDRSLDLFGAHVPPSILSIYPIFAGAPSTQWSVGPASSQALVQQMPNQVSAPSLMPSQIQMPENYGIGGMGRRESRINFMEDSSEGLADSAIGLGGGGGEAIRARSSSAPMAKVSAAANMQMAIDQQSSPVKIPTETPGPSLRSNFSETAFFKPHLILDKNGESSFEFEVPDSVTSWKVLAHALTRDLRSGSVDKETRSVKELMVRPYLPRFFREGDAATIKISVNNSSAETLSGSLVVEIEDTDTGLSAADVFGLKDAKKTFSVPNGESVTLSFPVRAPQKIGNYALKATATSKNYADGERRPLPVLPSRMHLAQSRFVTLNNSAKKVMEFKDLAAGSDPTLLQEKMVVSVDAQLFYGVLQALPYLVNYPYECVEQTMNRFVSTGIVSSVFAKYPVVAKMAQEFSRRKTRVEDFTGEDANRRISLEETPWLESAKGEKSDPLLNILDSRLAASARDSALSKIKKMQAADGSFSWFEGGKPDEYMTLYVLLSFSRALEFNVDVPKANIARGWKYIRGWLDRELDEMMKHDCCVQTITMLNYALSAYPDDSWTANSFDLDYRKRLLAYSFSQWKKHSPLTKGYLALTLNRLGRKSDAKLVWDSVMDSAKHNDELGTYWAREDRSWLWYNDEIESHAFALRVQMELEEKNKHNEGMVQWLFLNKKLNHWKSTRATAEVIYSLVHYLNKTAQLDTKEAVQVSWAGQKTEFTFDPEKYTGKKNQIVLPGEKVTKDTARIEVSKSTPGFAFASATWHFSTEKLPAESSGDFFQVNRKYFRRVAVGTNWQLQPLASGEKVKVGDQIEVQISLRTKHEAEYVHLRDPRGAGFEPENVVSGWKWDLGLGWYEEIRDSGANFFFNRLPVGEYNFKYRLRANMAGEFRVGPATVQSMYAPEFNAYSSGSVLSVAE